MGFEIRLIGRPSANTFGVPKSIIDPPKAPLLFRTDRRGEAELSRRMLNRSVLLDIRLFRLGVDMLLFRDIFGVDTLLVRRGILDGCKRLPLPPTTPNKPF